MDIDNVRYRSIQINGFHEEKAETRMEAQITIRSDVSFYWDNRG